MKTVVLAATLVAALIVPAAEGETVSVSSRVTALDTRVFGSVRSVFSVDDVLPLAYDASWGAGTPSALTLAVIPLDDGMPVEERRIVFPLTNGAGTVAWKPTLRQVYRVELGLSDTLAWTADFDSRNASGIENVAGVVLENGDVFYERLRLDSGEAISLVIPNVWLEAMRVIPEIASDPTSLGSNGLPYWRSYLEGLDPNVKISERKFQQYRPADLCGSLGSVIFDEGFSSTNGWRVSNYENHLTIRLDADAADGKGVLFVGGATNSCDTAWRFALAQPRKLTARGGGYVFAVDMRASCNIYRLDKLDSSWVSSISWYDADGLRISSEQLRLKVCRSDDWRRVWRTGLVPEGAVAYAFQLGFESPNLGPGQSVEFRHPVLGLTDATWAVTGDESLPRVRLLTPSPTEDGPVALRVSIADDSSVLPESVRIAVDGRDETDGFSREGDVWTLADARTWARGVHTVDIEAADWYGLVRKSRKLFFIGGEPSAGTVEICSDGTIVTDGEPFFPIGVYAVTRNAFNGCDWDNALSGLGKAGVNTVHAYGTSGQGDEFLGAAGRHGMRVLTAYRTGSWDAIDFPGTDFAARLRQQPTTLAWYLADDTSCHQSPEELEDYDDAVKALDPNHPSAQADALGISRFGDSYSNYVSKTDIFIPEFYPIRVSGACREDCVAEVVRQMKRCHEDVAKFGEGRPKAIVPVIQNFGERTWLMPSSTEVTAMTFAAVVQGANGIMWYSYGSADGMTTTPARWGGFARLSARLAELAPALLDETVSARRPEILSGPETDAFGQPAVSVLVKRHAGCDYAIAVNACSENVRAKVFVPGEADEADVLWEGRQLNARSGVLTDDFAPFAVHVYRRTCERRTRASQPSTDGGSNALQPIVTVPQELNALLSESGGIEGVCCSPSRIYLAHATGIEALDWTGRVVGHADVPDGGLRDLAYADGSVYGAFARSCSSPPGLIRVWNEDFDIVREEPFDVGLCGIAVANGCVYAGVADSDGRETDRIRVKKLTRDFEVVRDVTVSLGFPICGSIRSMTTDGTNVFCLVDGTSGGDGLAGCGYIIELTPELGLIRATSTVGESEGLDLVPSAVSGDRSCVYLSVEALNGNYQAWLADPANCPPQVRLNFSTTPQPEGTVSHDGALLDSGMDTRSFGSLRRIPVCEILPLAYSNDREWTPGGRPEDPPAQIFAAPGTLFSDSDDSSFTQTGRKEALVADSGEGVVAGWRPTEACYRVTLEVNGEVRESVIFVFGDVVVSDSSRAAALDTRVFVPRRTLATDELLPFAYDTAWWPGAAAIAALTVAPLANGVAETVRQVAVPVTDAVGTGPWTPTHREIYRAEIRTTDGATETVDLDLTGAKELAVMGVLRANGDIVFERLRDAAGREATLELPDDWLDARSVSRTAARDTLRLGANGIPVWQSYVLGLDPADETSLPTVRIVPTDANTFRVEVEGLDDLATDRVSLTYELLSTDDLDKAFESDRAEQREETFAELPRNGPRRFYRPCVRIYWKGADK